MATRLVCLTLALLGSAVPARPQQRTVILDLSAAPRVLMVEGSGEACPAKAQEMRRYASTRNTSRWIATKGDTLRIVVLRPGTTTAKLEPVVEKPRQTRFGTQLPTLARLALIVATTPVLAGEAPAIGCLETNYILQHERSELLLTATVTPSPPSPRDTVAQEKPSPPDTSGVSSLNHPIVTGPAEHWYLSADVPVAAVRYDGDDFKRVNSPAEFYLGLNYLFGDLLSPDRRAWESLGLKGFMRVSRDPLESWGLALTLRGELLKRLPGFDAIAPFLGVASSRRDAEASSEEGSSPGKERKWELVIGAGFHLDQALKWVP